MKPQLYVNRSAVACKTIKSILKLALIDQFLFNVRSYACAEGTSINGHL